VVRVPKPGFWHALVDFKLIFDVPPKLTNPQSLRTVLLSEKSYPLDERLELPKKLTASILFVPQCNSFTRIFDQKQSLFSKTNILKLKHRFFPGLSNSVSRTELPFFQGMIFGTTICVVYSIVPKGSQLIALPLDRHPSRQDTQSEIDYRMQHDIYTLGVVLLEIGLWTSFAVEDSECDSNLPTPSNILDSVKLDLLYPLSVAAEKKQRLEYLAAHELPPRLGRRYADIVLLCLQCLDAGDGKGESEKLSSPWTDQDGVVIGVRFMENVLTKMQEIMI
jgi:hypothetical protein